MRRTLVAVCGLILLPLLPSPASAVAPVVRVVDFDRMVNPLTAQRIVRAIDDAEAAGDSLVLITLDTPGGLVTSMETIVKRMLASEVPIVAWVGPSGAHAASAGFVILMASDVAAMAPGTRTGAASTVIMGGENQDGDVMLRKANEDIAALVRSIARQRDRNPEVCESAVFEAKAFEESRALELGLIDLVAADRNDLLEQLDGREIARFDGSRAVLETSGATFVESEFSFRHVFMETLAHPVVAYLLFLGGIVGLYVEFTSPGGIFPGVLGALCLLLFVLSAQALPVSAVGVLLILLAIVMFLLEVKITSFGLLTLGGVVCLALGSWMLIDGPIPELRVPLWVIVPTSAVIAGFCALAVHLAAKAQRARVSTGVEGLETALAVVERSLDPQGKVFLEGELWDAVSAVGPIPRGSRVQVVKVDRMRLVVKPVDDPLIKPRAVEGS